MDDSRVMTVLQSPGQFVRRRPGRPRKSRPQPYVIPECNLLKIRETRPLDKVTSQEKKKTPTLRMVKMGGGVWSSSVLPKEEDSFEETKKKLKQRFGDGSNKELLKKRRGRPRKVRSFDVEEKRSRKIVNDESKIPERRSRRSQKSLVSYEDCQEDDDDGSETKIIADINVKRGRGRPPKQSKTGLIKNSEPKKKRGRPKKSISGNESQDTDETKTERTTPLLSLFESLQLTIEDDGEVVKSNIGIVPKTELEDQPSTSRGENSIIQDDKTVLEMNGILDGSAKKPILKSVSPISSKDIIPIGRFQMEKRALIKTSEQVKVRLIRMNINPFNKKIAKEKLEKSCIQTVVSLGCIENIKKEETKEIKETPIKEEEAVVDTPAVESDNVEVQKENSTDVVIPEIKLNDTEVYPSTEHNTVDDSIPQSEVIVDEKKEELLKD